MLVTTVSVIASLVSWPAYAENVEETLELFNAWQEESASVSGADLPLPDPSWHISVITAEEIRSLHVHTLAEVLSALPSLRPLPPFASGVTQLPCIQAVACNELLVLADGIPLRNLGPADSETVRLPTADQIERILILNAAPCQADCPAPGKIISIITEKPVTALP